MPYLVALILLLLVLRPTSADLTAAETAEQRGDLAAVYQASKADAEAGDARCQNYLGVISERGRGVPRDLEAALGWFRRAATSGFAPAQLNLAAALDHGRVMRHDPLPAYIWYSIAARLASDPVLRD